MPRTSHSSDGANNGLRFGRGQTATTFSFRTHIASKSCRANRFRCVWSASAQAIPTWRMLVATVTPDGKLKWEYFGDVIPFRD
jgi:hypothetical protein